VFELFIYLLLVHNDELRKCLLQNYDHYQKSTRMTQARHEEQMVIIIIIIISVMELCHLLTRSGLTYPEVPSKVCHDSFCQL
jgi:hypothetical protein